MNFKILQQPQHNQTILSCLTTQQLIPSFLISLHVRKGKQELMLTEETVCPTP